MLPGGCAEPSGHYGSSPGQSGHSGGSHSMKKQSLKILKNRYFAEFWCMLVGGRSWHEGFKKSLDTDVF